MRGSAAEPGQAGEVVGEVGQTDFDAGAHHADGAHDETKPAFLGGEDVLDARAHPGAGGVAAGDVRRHLPAARLLRWNCGLRPRRSSKARFAAERWAASAHIWLAVLSGSSTAPS